LNETLLISDVDLTCQFCPWPAH